MLCVASGAYNQRLIPANLDLRVSPIRDLQTDVLPRDLLFATMWPPVEEGGCAICASELADQFVL